MCLQWHCEKRSCPISNQVYPACDPSVKYVNEMTSIFSRLLYRYDFKLSRDDRTGEGNMSMMWGRKKKRQYQTRDAFVPLRDGTFESICEAGVRTFVSFRLSDLDELLCCEHPW